MRDPVRPEISALLSQFQATVMITDDQLGTAETIARQAQFADEIKTHDCMVQHTLPSELDAIDVFARVSPLYKLSAMAPMMVQPCGRLTPIFGLELQTLAARWPLTRRLLSIASLDWLEVITAGSIVPFVLNELTKPNGGEITAAMQLVAERANKASSNREENQNQHCRTAQYNYRSQTCLTARTFASKPRQTHREEEHMDVGAFDPSKAAVIDLRTRRLSASERRIKRGMDLAIGFAIVLFLSPLMLVVAIAIKLDSAGPILFRQERRGHSHTTFGCLKFRTMCHDLTDHDSAQQTRFNDPRVTRLGRILRKYSMDELPQLFNVITGDMSLVGPRPHALGTSIDGVLLPDAHPEYLLRYSVRPGITGWAQVNGWRGNLDTQEKLIRRVEHDLYYIENWSLALDLRILVRTFTCLFGDEKAY